MQENKTWYNWVIFDKEDPPSFTVNASKWEKKTKN